MNLRREAASLTFIVAMSISFCRIGIDKNRDAYGKLQPRARVSAARRPTQSAVEQHCAQ